GRDRPQVVGVAARQTLDQVSELRRECLFVVALADPGCLLDDLADRPVRDALSVRETAPLVHGGGGYAAAELLEQPTLARARRTEDRRHHRTPLGLDDPPELEQLLELKLPTDERCAGNRALGDVLLDAADVPNLD